MALGNGFGFELAEGSPICAEVNFIAGSYRGSRRDIISCTPFYAK